MWRGVAQGEERGMADNAEIFQFIEIIFGNVWLRRVKAASTSKHRRALSVDGMGNLCFGFVQVLNSGFVMEGNLLRSERMSGGIVETEETGRGESGLKVFEVAGRHEKRLGVFPHQLINNLHEVNQGQ
jgi:hypothetical protein